MIGSLQLQYNRGRQAVITNELIDIITVSGEKRAVLIMSRVLLRYRKVFGYGTHMRYLVSVDAHL